MLNRPCLFGQLFGEPCDVDTADGELCDPCARQRLLLRAERLSESAEDAYVAGYAQGWADRTGRAAYGDLDGLAAYLRMLPHPAG